ncbi:MAG: glycerol-3-phosphate acyltransferase [Promethearchaeota archaeon]|jgi:glycerol-3-phosphate acyltransferase PlsY
MLVPFPLPIPAAITLNSGILIIAVSDYVSTASLTGAFAYALLSLLLFWQDKQFAFISATILLALFVFYTHRSNITRLFRGEEPKHWDIVKLSQNRHEK